MTAHYVRVYIHHRLLGISLILRTSTCLCAVVSGEESEGEEGEGENKAEVTLKMKQAMLEEEKQALLQNKELLDEVSTNRASHYRGLFN